MQQYHRHRRLVTQLRVVKATGYRESARGFSVQIARGRDFAGIRVDFEERDFIKIVDGVSQSRILTHVSIWSKEK